MKVGIICFPVAAAFAFWLAVERQAALRLTQKNGGLRDQLSEMDKLIAQNQRLSNLVARVNNSPSAGRPAESSLPSDDLAAELVRLRGEVETLRDQSKEIENLQANTLEARAAAETALKARHVNPAADNHGATTVSGSQLELLAANYWTDRTNLDVAEALRERIRGDSLKAIASNNLKSDPDFGQVKHLTVVYRFGGVIMTNEFLERASL